jgi:hypothetical protein
MTQVEFMKQIVQSDSILQMYLASLTQSIDPLTPNNLFTISDLKRQKTNEIIITNQDVQIFKKEYYKQMQLPSLMAMGKRF